MKKLRIVAVGVVCVLAALIVAVGAASLVPASADAAAQIPQSDKIFLKVDGIDGEAGDAGHVGDMIIDSFVLGNSTSSPSVASTPGLTTVQLSMRADKGLPPLIQKVMSRKVTPKAVLTNRTALGQDYLVWTFSNVKVSALRVDGNVGEPRAQVSFALTFEKIAVEYRPLLVTGGLGPAVRGEWDSTFR